VPVLSVRGSDDNLRGGQGLGDRLDQSFTESSTCRLAAVSSGLSINAAPCIIAVLRRRTRLFIRTDRSCEAPMRRLVERC